jgi:Na+/proline symporter
MFPASYLLYSLFVAPKMTMQSLTIYEHIGYFYGEKIQAILSLLEVCRNIGLISMQLTVIGIAANMIFGVDVLGRNIIISLSAIGLATYSAFGGLRSVSITDIVQGLAFMILIPFFAIYIWSATPDHSGFIAQFYENKPRMSLSKNFSSVASTISILAIWSKALVPWFSTRGYQRVVINKGPRRAKKNLLMVTLIFTSVSLLLAFISLQLYGVNPNLKLNDIFPFMIEHYSFNGINGTLFITIFAMVISTVDSDVNAVSVLLTNDILPRVNKKFKQKTYNTAVYTTFIVVAIALYFSLNSNDVFKMLMYSSNFTMPICVITLSNVLGFRTHTNVIWAAIISAFVATVSYSFFMRGTGFAQYAFFPGMCACGASIILGHLYYTKIKGWKNDKEEPYYDPYTPEQNAAMLRRAETGEWKTAFNKAMDRREFEKKYKEIMIEKMKLTVEEYEEEKQKKEEEVNKTIENVRKNILDSKKKEEEVNKTIENVRKNILDSKKKEKKKEHME